MKEYENENVNVNMNKRTFFSSMKRLSVFLMVLTLVFTVSCSKCSKKEQETAGQAGVGGETSLIPVIAEVKMAPAEPASVHNLRAVTVLKDLNTRGLKYTYRWFVNGDEVSNHNSGVLETENYKKGDRVYFEVTVMRGRYQSDPEKSEAVTIGNARPVVRLNPVRPFSVPGRFVYRINATDPDGDALTYHLVSPLDRGIDLDPETGEITWDIEALPAEEEEGVGRPEDESAGQTAQTRQKSPAKSFSPIVNIKFEVRDADGAVVVSSVVINLAEGGEVSE
jgi:hypothetical protein